MRNLWYNISHEHEKDVSDGELRGRSDGGQDGGWGASCRVCARLQYPPPTLIENAAGSLVAALRALAVAAGTLAALAPVSASAEVRLARVFQDNMVLQAGKRVSVWGFGAAPGAAVEVSFAGEKAGTVAASDGRWKATFANPFGVSHEARELVVDVPSEARRIVVRNVLVGEVWILAGQSNMALRMRDADDLPLARARCGDAAHRSLRYLNMTTVGRQSRPQADLPADAAWWVCSPENVAGMSATGFFFGESLLLERNVPVGLIMVARGATQIQNWLPEDAFGESAFFDLIRRNSPQDIAEAEARSRQTGQEIPGDQCYLSRHYNAKVAPLEGLACRGVVWYQGETGGWSIDDNPRQPASHFAEMLSTLIGAWRRHWADESLWFAVYELPSLEAGESGSQGWPQMRTQLREATARVSNAVAVNIVDTGWQHDVHPRDKAIIGQRGARQVLRAVYGDASVLPPPKFETARFDAAGADVLFAAEPRLVRRNEAALRGAGFELLFDAGWTSAVATLADGNRVRVANPPGVTARAKGVRYLYRGWDKPDAWLYNEQAYPAETFKYLAPAFETDDSTDRCRYSESARGLPPVQDVENLPCPATEDGFKALARRGVRRVRVRLSGCPQEAIAAPAAYADWLSDEIGRLKTVAVPQARASGLKVVIALSSTPGGKVWKLGRVDDHAVFWSYLYKDLFVESWKRLATALKGDGDVICGYELLDDPFQRQGVPYDYWRVQFEAAQAVRAVDSETPIIVTSNEGGSDAAYRYMKPLPFANVFYAVRAGMGAGLPPVAAAFAARHGAKMHVVGGPVAVGKSHNNTQGETK